MTRWWLLIGLLTCAAGCTSIRDGTHAVCYRLFQAGEDHLECARNRKWAEAAWLQASATVTCAHTEDYGAGFQDGFADHLYAGTVVPPPLPPKRYRHIEYQTPEGYQAIEAWFAGYRHGVVAAQQGGYRRWITGPAATSVAPAAPAVDLHVPQMSPTDAVPTPAPAPTPAPPAPPEMPPAEAAAPSRAYRLTVNWALPW
jgi:hypothetical protein